MSPSHFPPLPDSETALPPPPPDPQGTYFYGYKLFDGDYDKNNEAHQARMAEIRSAAGRLGLYARLARSSPTVMLFLAVYNPNVKIATPRAGNSRVPCQRRLEDLQRELGIDFGPSWHADNGNIFRKGYTMEDWVYSMQPVKGLWSL
ncbi:hypothetical protein B0H17DRAFT_1075688 [Mycena rosella]|uniref:Uncharacterized protein n=1 Tax=Mycena rosella TaxID=1033263 RepID=A0AAD7GA34_MYCRO|nr:hypothetical protein B0H17DRAFT_1075688 [Mycena rosella]